MAGLLITGRCSRIVAAFVKMIPFLTANYDLIPQMIPAFLRANIDSYIPKRLFYLRSFKTVDLLKNGKSDDNYFYFEELR